MAIYPNPAHSQLQLSLDNLNQQKVYIRISDLAGRPVLADAIENEEEPINISRLSRGVYIIEVTSGPDVIREKLIKK